jgi:hypothetical protein
MIMDRTDAFNLADSDTDEKTVDALNTSFNSISDMCDEFTNYVTPQDYEVFTYSGLITKDVPIKLSKRAASITNIWGVNLYASNTGYSKLGVLSGNTFMPNATAYVYICQPFKLDI